jgi:drug/metabolite transporter (DMT)-like permease
MPSTQPDDGTRQLLQAGVWTLAAGVLAALLTATVFGGIGPQGPHTSSGWLVLIIAMMCLPFGSMAFVLGAAKWLRNRRIAAAQSRGSTLPLKPVSRDAKSLLSFSEHSMEHRSHGKERQ